MEKRACAVCTSEGDSMSHRGRTESFHLEGTFSSRGEAQICSHLAKPLQGPHVLHSWSLSSRNFSDGWTWEKELDRISSAPFSFYPLGGSACLARRVCSDLQFALWLKELPSRNRNEKKLEVFQLCQRLNMLNLGGAVLAPGFKSKKHENIL